jgi:hypothetical protein
MSEIVRTCSMQATVDKDNIFFVNPKGRNLDIDGRTVFNLILKN